MADIPEGTHISYQFQHRKCGKCKACKQGPGHGPYIYAYWYEQGRGTRSKNTGKILQVEIVKAYYHQVWRVSAIERESQESWETFKTNTLGQPISDDSLTQEHLRTIALSCKEKCRRKASPCATITVIEQQASVA
jgi:hypothetical protein